MLVLEKMELKENVGEKPAGIFMPKHFSLHMFLFDSKVTMRYLFNSKYGMSEHDRIINILLSHRRT